jgi:hypothetical protein
VWEDSVATFENLFVAVLTKNEDDAGTDSNLNLTVNVDGEDVFDHDYSPDVDDGEAELLGGGLLSTPLDSTGLTNSSIRLGIRDDDAWGPLHVLVFGQTQPAFVPGTTVALAMETDLTHWLSTDTSEGHLTMPIRLVGSGNASTVIRRVLLLVDTIWEYDSDTETDSPIQLQIVAGGNIVLQQQIGDTPQPDLEAATTNWYFVDVAVPFTRGDVVANGGIRLSILGDDAWKPMRLFVFGLDTETGRPSQVVSLVSVPVWTQGWMSTDPSEGVASVDLPVLSN